MTSDRGAVSQWNRAEGGRIGAVICFAAQTHAAWLIHPIDQVTRLLKRTGPAGGHVPTFAATAIAVGSRRS